VRPYAQRALLDGVEIARDEQLVAVPVPPGEHELRIEHPCCAPFVRQLTQSDAAATGELRVPLEPRPARLRVDGEPTTMVFVEGQPAGTAGDSQRVAIDVPVPPGGASPYEGTVHVRMERAGVAPTEVSVRIRAGESLTVAAPQAPPPDPRPASEAGDLPTEPATEAAPAAGAESAP
jgi:serine/threonine-protein kinase